MASQRFEAMRIYYVEALCVREGSAQFVPVKYRTDANSAGPPDQSALL